MEEKKSHIKNVDNIIHIRYLGQILSKDDLKEIENNLEKINYELKGFDYSRVPQNSLDSIISQVVLMFNKPTTQTIVLGLTTNLIWDVIKKVVKYTFLKIKDKSFITIDSGRNVKEKKASFSIIFQIDNNNTFEFKTDNLNEENIEHCLDKILEFLKTTQKPEKPKVPQISVYNSTSEKWEIIEITPEYLQQLPSKIIKELTLDEFIRLHGM